MDAAAIEAFIERVFPQAAKLPAKIEALTPGSLKLRLRTDRKGLRPGGTVSGPVLMTLSDTAMYYLVLSLIGEVELAYTTNLNINFLRTPKPGDIVAHAALLKLGKRLAVGEVTLYSGELPDPVAHATVTYSIPPADR